MKNSHFQHLLLTICCAAGLSSCIYSDMGRTIGSIGTKVPRLVPMANDEHWTASYCGHLYQKEGRYYVSIPLAWVPKRRRVYEFFPLFSNGNPFEDSCTYNRPYSAAELQQYPATPEYYEAPAPRIIRFHEPDAHGAIGLLKASLKPAPDFDPAGAESLGLFGVENAAPGVDLDFSDPWYDYTRPSFIRPKYATGFTAPEDMAGKCLILGNKRFEFPAGNSHRHASNGYKYYHHYNTWHQSITSHPTLHEDCRRLGASGFIHRNIWLLYFTSPTTGTAVRLHSTPQDNQPADLPFRITELK